MKTKILLFSMIVMMLNQAIGQTKMFPASIGITGGLTEYMGDLGQSAYTFKEAKPFVGLSFGYYITPHFDFNFNTALGKFSYKEPKNLKFDSKLWVVNTNFHFKLLDASKHKLVPYLLVGIGMANYGDYALKTTIGNLDVNSLRKSNTDLFLAFGAGAQYAINDRFNVFVQEKFAYTDHDDRDGEERNTNDAFLMHTIGISYNFSLKRDTDGDGVTDNKDKCPKTPTGEKVDVHGCPLDRDEDGIIDRLDSCPDIKGMPTAHGCPDKDGDSIVDGNDKCPDDFGIIAMMGCPDIDGDSIADPDDECPTEPGSLTMRGCPDKDGDSIPDKDDKCPEVAGLPGNNGCPEVKEVPAIALQVILFKTGKYIIRPAYYDILNNVVKVMNENPEYKLSIEGHADNKGDAAMNRGLSDRRANAVMKYLISKKIDSSRLKAKGFGATVPATSNATKAGRMKNRRVEFKIEF